MITSRQFTYDETSRTFVADISDFGPGFELEQLHPDACDLGLRVLSNRTHATVAYVVAEVIRADGETRGWRLLPTAASKRQHPQCIGTEVLLIND